MTTAVPSVPLERGPITINVPLPGRAYDVLIGSGLVAQAGPLVREALRRPRAFVVSDEAVNAQHGLGLFQSLAAAGIRADGFAVPVGEASKSMEMLEKVVDRILAAQLERSDPVIAFGGGVVGDLAGFAAAIARRGMPFVQIPTTLLAQVDSAVGGKTGVNSRHGKNLIGAFHQPALVLADTGVLDTLPERERRAGYAEVVKVGLLGDRNFFEHIETLGVRALSEEIDRTVATAVAAKAAIVVEDERESGARALLNLGHTFGHAIERGCQYKGIVHGEAVAIGLCLAFRMSEQLGLCSTQDAARVTAHLKAVGLPTALSDVPTPMTVSAMMDAIRQDKKVKDGALRFVLVRGIGEAFVSDGVAPAKVEAFLQSEGLPAS